jgi:hypothetical protein
LIEVFQKSSQQILRKSPSIVFNYARFDAAHFARQLKIPVIGFGPGKLGCSHLNAEHIQIIVEVYKSPEDNYRDRTDKDIQASKILCSLFWFSSYDQKQWRRCETREAFKGSQVGVKIDIY